jgi:hypothetical protein
MYSIGGGQEYGRFGMSSQEQTGNVRVEQPGSMVEARANMPVRVIYNWSHVDHHPKSHPLSCGDLTILVGERTSQFSGDRINQSLDCD